MENKYLWATEEIFGSIEEWNKAFEIAKTSYDFSAYKGKLGDADEFFKCMKEDEKISRALDKLSVYAMMKHDENTKDSQFDALLSKVTALGAKIGAATAYIVPELTSLPEETLVDFIGNPKLKDYDYMLKGILKAKDHVLSESEEEMLAMLGETTASFRDIFTKIDNADLPLKTVKSGKDIIPLSHGTYGVIMHGEDRALRKKAYNKYYGAYLSLMNTISATYYGSVKKDVFYAKAKKHSSALEAALFNEDVPKVVYDNLISSVEKALPTLHAYMREKKKLLKLKRMYMYDVYVPVVEGAEMKLDYDKAYDLVVKGLQPLGKEYQDLLVKAKNERWLDVYEKDGKRSGAYSVAVFDTHPYVLLNYQKTTHDIFTIAHEMGHSIHSYFSNRTQPYAKADYRIFVAEVASTVNEVLLIKHLLATEKDKKLKKYLLSYLLEMIRTTLFRQTQFAEFEQFSHSTVEKGEPLTKENMSEEYLRLNKKYYGKAVISDQNIKYEWARIPHFYRAFYVYKYATGIISALAIAERILTEGQKAVEDYFKFLSSGGSDAPCELLKIAGVDLTTDKPFKSAFKVFKDTLEEFKSL
ncbi:MAG: oligoendopeptidase F [Clostridia bacterium]|nr:oligoendopeptidase F [Clostridia bacterium]